MKLRMMIVSLILVTPVLTKPVAAQEEGYKSPGTATIIGVIVPGGGQLYAGSTTKGMTLLGASIGGVGLSLAGATQGNTGLSLGGLAVEIGAWAYGWATAGGDANRHNATLHAAVAPAIRSLPEGRMGVGLQYGF